MLDFNDYGGCRQCIRRFPLSPPYTIVKTLADAGVFSLLGRDKSARVTVRVTVVIKKVLQIIEPHPLRKASFLISF
jgi:hypothetical protein